MRYVIGQECVPHPPKTVSFSFKSSKGAVTFQNVKGIGVTLSGFPVARVSGVTLGQTGYTVNATVLVFKHETLTEPY